MVASRGIVHPCGQCLFCRINRKREWIGRLLLEAASHPYNQFWTLTYEDSRLPNVVPLGSATFPDQSGIQNARRRASVLAAASQSGTLFKPDLALFFKRYRKNIGDLRYYAVGEYGEQRGRPHYHVLAFGTRCSPETLAETWKHGAVHIGNVEAASINYCVEYALKREKSQDLVAARRQPEFAVMSTKPPLGCYAIGEFRRSILSGVPTPTGEFVIPDSFRVLGRDYPLPRFIRNALEDEGFLSPRSAVRQNYTDTEVLRSLLSRSRIAQDEFKKLEILLSNDPASEADARRQVQKQKVLNAESRQRIFGDRHETL